MPTTAVQLTEDFDPADLPQGVYVVSSRSPAYAAALDAIDGGFAVEVGERDTEDGELLRVFRVGSSRTNPEGGEGEGGEAFGAVESLTVSLGPEYFQLPLKEYGEWPVKWWREVVQNGVDAGATEMRLAVIENEDGTRTVSAQDNGNGMDRNILVNKFLKLGATTKTGAAGSTGGFGKAKELILFPWLSWRILTRDLQADGEGAPYKLQRVRTPVDGTIVEATMAGASTTTLAAAREFLQRSHITQTSFRLASAADELGERFTAPPANVRDMRVLEDGAQYTIFFEERDEHAYEAWIRSNGLYMFSVYVGKIPGRMVIELKGASVELLKANRDGFREKALERQISAFAERLAKDTKSALRAAAGHVRKKYSSGKKFRAEVVVPYDAQTEKTASGRADILTAGTVIEIVGQMRELATQSGNEALADRADLAQALLADLQFNGDRGLEEACKALSWEPDFVLVSEIDNFRVPAKFTPEKMTVRVKRFANVWTETCRWVLMQLGCGQPYSIGFIFSPDSLAAYLNEDGEHWLLINPFRGKEALEAMKSIHHGWSGPEVAEDLESFQVTDREDFKLLYAMAVHECTHFADSISYHDEAFAAALTFNMAKCADGMAQYKKILGATSERKQRSNPEQIGRVELQRGDVVKIGKTQWIVYRAIDNFTYWVYKWPSKKSKVYTMRVDDHTHQTMSVFESGGSGQRISEDIVAGPVTVVAHLEEGSW